MSHRSNWKTYLWALSLLALLVIALVPAAWAAAPLSPPRQTVPPPVVPTPFPVPPVIAPPVILPPFVVPPPVDLPPVVPFIVEQALVLGEAVEVVVTVRNEGDLAMEGSAIRLEESVGLEYLVDGELQTAPYLYPLETLQPGEEREFVFSVILSDDAVPCETYTVRVSLDRQEEVSQLREVEFTAPCPVLPDVGG